MRLILSVFTSLICLSVFSQSPEKINYQSIVRDLSGNVIQNQPISLRISILSTSITGSVVYQETFQPTTNDFGLVNIKIGEGAAVVGTMSGVDWSSGLFFLESAVDVSGGSNYTVVSTSQFMSVPYALYANESPLDTNIVQNIVSLQTSNYLDSSAVQNLIDNSSTTNVDSSTVASWGYLDSNSIMIIINNTALDSLGIQSMIDNSITNVDSSTVSSWGYLDSITIQNLINNSVSNVDSSTVANWGYLDSNSIMVLINNNSIDSITVASWGYLDSVSIQNMINNSIVNIDSTSIANFGYVAGPHTIDTDTQIDSTGIALMGYLDSVSIRNMIDSAITSALLSSSNNSGSTFGEFRDITDSVIIGNTMVDTLRSPSDGLIIVRGKSNGGSSPLPVMLLRTDTLKSFTSNAGQPISYNKIWAPNQTNAVSSMTCPVKKDWYWKIRTNVNAIIEKVYWIPIINDSNNSSTIDSTTIANLGFIAGNTDTQIDSTGIAALGFVAGSTVDTQIDSTGIANFGYVAGPHTIDTDTQLDSTGIASLGFVAGSTVDTQIDSTGIAALGYVAGPKTIDTDTDTQLDSTGIAALGYVAGPKTIDTDTQLDSAGVANYGFIDSVTVMNMINNSSGGSGNSFAFPEGYNGTPITHFFGGGSYTVPAGKSLYITTRYSSNSNLKINNTTVLSGTNNYGGGSLGLFLPLILNSGDVLTSSSSDSFNGFLVDENLTAVTHPFSLGTYTVPANKRLYVLNRYSPSGDFKIGVGSIAQGTFNYGGGSGGLLQPVLVNPGQTVSSSNTTQSSFNGYLAPIDYFSSSSSNSGSGSSTTIDSTTIANLGYVAGPHTIDTDTQIDSTGIAALGYVAGPKTIDTDTDTQLDSAGIAALGFVAGSIVDTQIDSTGIAALGYVAGPKTIDTQLDSAAIAAMGFVDSVAVQNMIDSAVAASSSGSGNSSGHYVGELYGGGVVFYVDHTGENGLIVSTTDANTSGAQWSTSYNNISNCDSKINGDSNTLSILNNGNGPAALLCDSYNSGGYNDWYLPAIWEFNLLSKNAYPVMKTLEGISNSDFFQETYWTSTQGSNPVYAYIFKLVSPSTASHMITWSGKDGSYAVRPIRKFTSSSGSGSGSSNGNSSGNKTLIYQTNGF
ncbi:hypothetical protein PQZ52_02185 [Flavobacteriales bacterium]|nr:hypothetical protein [Flavobacteriales bacterium]